MDELLSVLQADARLREILLSQVKIEDNRKDRLGESIPLIHSAVNIVANAHKKGGCTLNQCKELETINMKVKALL